MGQRHQIYVKLPKKYYNEKNPNNKDSTVIGIHHQWIWGKTALTMLRNFIQFCLNADEYNPFITKEIEGTISDLFNNTKEFHFHPIGARDYIRLHYPDPKGNYECESDCPCQKKGESKLKAIHEKSNLEHELACQGLIEFFTNHENLEVLTLAEVQAIFPKMFKKQIKQEVKAIEAPKPVAKKKAKKSSKK